MKAVRIAVVCGLTLLTLAPLVFAGDPGDGAKSPSAVVPGWDGGIVYTPPANAPVVVWPADLRPKPDLLGLTCRWRWDGPYPGSWVCTADHFFCADPTPLCYPPPYKGSLFGELAETDCQAYPAAARPVTLDYVPQRMPSVRE